MQLVLVPSNQSMDIKQVYEKAFSEATELYVLSAYLTAWDFHKALNPECRKFRLIVGTDFGITRKQALETALAWLPNDQKCNFLVADKISGFHPKAAFWKDKMGECYCLIGSSNQTNAAFEKNCEANALMNITSKQFDQAFEWIQGFLEKCSPVNEHWIDNYEESKTIFQIRSKNNDRQKCKKAYVIEVPLTFGEKLIDRAKQMKAYAETRDDFMVMVKECADGNLSSIDFYQEFVKLWGKNHLVSFQSDVWKISGKNSDFSDACDSLIKVRDSDVANLDDVVKVELDRLEKLNIPIRKSLFTELLCKEFPDRFPVWNKPIERYLKW